MTMIFIGYSVWASFVKVNRYALEDAAQYPPLVLFLFFYALVAFRAKGTQVDRSVVLLRAVDVFKVGLNAWSEFHATFLTAAACALKYRLLYRKREVLILFLVIGWATTGRTEKRHVQNCGELKLISCYFQRILALLATA